MRVTKSMIEIGVDELNEVFDSSFKLRFNNRRVALYFNRVRVSPETTYKEFHKWLHGFGKGMEYGWGYAEGQYE